MDAEGLELEMGDVPPAPKIIHFLWAGGEKRLPEKSRLVILQWLIKNPDFTIYLWIDKETCESLKNTIRRYETEFKESLEVLQEDDEYADYTEGAKKIPIAFLFFQSREVRSGETPLEKGNLFPGHIVIKDIAECGLRREWISYFIELPQPNYGASSDLLRLLALELGGAYFDSDVGPGPQSLGDLPIFNMHGKHRALFDDFTQTSKLSDKELVLPFAIESKKEGVSHHVGNDVIASTKGNPLMRYLYNYAVKKLERFKHYKETRFAVCYGARDIRGLTIDATGPVCLREGIMSCQQRLLERAVPRGVIELTVVDNKEDYEVLPVKVELSAMRTVGCVPIFPLPPTNSWVKANRREYPSADKLCKAIAKTIVFECGYFQIVRVDDHIEDLIQLSADFSDEDKFDEVKAYKFLSSIVPIEKMPPGTLLGVTGRFEISSVRLKNAIPRDPEDIKNMVDCLGYRGKIFGLFNSDKKFTKKGFPGYLKDVRTHYELKGVPPIVLKGFFAQIRASFRLVEIYLRPDVGYVEAAFLEEARRAVLSHVKQALLLLGGILGVIDIQKFREAGWEDPEKLQRELMETEEKLEKILQPVRRGFWF